MMKKISIITICYNSKKFIRSTIESILSQDFREQMEFIVVDGGSTDGTVEIINEYKGGIDIFVSEPDTGIYNAMNKGISFAGGEWVCFMNSSDCFYSDDILSKAFKNKDYPDKIKVLYGESVAIKAGGSLKVNQCYPIKDLSYRMPFCHQATFVRLHTLREYPFDESYRIAADYNQFYTIYHNYGETAFHFLPFCIASCDDTDSVSTNLQFPLWKEFIRVRAAHKDLRWCMDRYIKLPIKLLLGYDKRK